MEKIVMSKSRFIFFVLLFIILIDVVLMITGINPKMIGLKAYLYSIFVSYSYCLFLQHKTKNRGIFFSKEKISIVDRNNESIELLWSDLELDISKYKYRAINIGGIKLKSKTKLVVSEPFELSWFNEPSALEVVKKYAPENSDIYKVLENYSGHRGLKF